MIRVTPVFWHRGLAFLHCSWSAPCSASGMLNMLTTPALTLVFMGIVFSLGTALVWMLWEIEPVITRMQRGIDRASRDLFG
jgi:hypothetical protein